MPRRQPDDRIVVGGYLGMILDRRGGVGLAVFSLCFHSYFTTTWKPKKLCLPNFKTRTRVRREKQLD